MSVASYDGQFSFKQDSLARLGPRDSKKMSANEYQAFQNSPFMQAVRKCEDLAWRFTCSRDEARSKRDPTFKPKDEDFSAVKAHEYDRCINYYKVLGIDEYSSLDEVKKAYKKLSLVYHPDKTAGLSTEQKEEYAAVFIELKNAYLTLGDQATRRQYDRDRDRDQASFEVQGFKPKVRAHFNATEMLKKLQEMQKAPGQIIEIPSVAKLEKFFYGGHKKIKRTRRVKDFDGFKNEIRIYRIDIPRGAPESFESTFKRQGDHHESTQPDTLNFRLTSKPHCVVERRGRDLVSKKSVYLGVDALREPYISAQAPSVKGRHILIWGQNPFHSCPGVAGGNLRINLKGEGLTQDGHLTVCCRLGASLHGEGTISAHRDRSSPSSMRPLAAKAWTGGGGYPAPSPSISSTSALAASEGASKCDTVIITLRHMQTEAKLWLRMPRNAVMADVRAKAFELLGLPPGSTLRLLQQIPGGLTPFPDRQPLNSLTVLNCAGTAWHKPEKTPERLSQFLRSAADVLDSEPLESELARVKALFRESKVLGSQARDMLRARLAERVLPDIGLEPSATALAEALAHVRAANKQAPAAAAAALARIDELELLGEGGHRPKAAVDGDSAPGADDAMAAPTSLWSRKRSTKRFLARFGLGPLEGFDRPGSDTEEEIAVTSSVAISRGGSLSSAADADGTIVSTKAPAMMRRIERLRAEERACHVDLEQVGEPITLFTRPTCTITFYSNGRQPSSVAASASLSPRPIFGISISSPACAKKGSEGDWESLKASLVPILQLTGFRLLRPAREVLPRPLPASSELAAGALEDAGCDVEAALVALECGAIDLHACATRLAISGKEATAVEDMVLKQRCAKALEEKAQFLRPWAALEWRLTSAGRANAPAASALSVPWKKIGDDAFRRSEFYRAIAFYSRHLAALAGPEAYHRSMQLLKEDAASSEAPQGAAAQEVAVLLSNRSACLAKIGHFEDALADARDALALRPAWGRAWGRVGWSARHLGRAEEAINAFLQATAAEPSASNVAALAEAAGAVPERTGDAAHSAKESGNVALRGGEIGMAIAQYTRGLALLPVCPAGAGAGVHGGPAVADEHAFLHCVLLCNRSAAFARLGDWSQALADARSAVAAKDDFEKAYCRLGTALLGCGFNEEAYYAFARALVLGANNLAALKGRQACISLLPFWSSQASRSRHRGRFSSDLSRPSGNVRVYAISDVHFDHKCNEEWAHGVDDFAFQEDVLIVAGNMCDTSNALRRALATFKSKFRRVFWVPGNHELWIHPSEASKYPDSFAKLLALLGICDELGVDVAPAALSQDLFVVPLLSWYSAEFDSEDPFPDPNAKVDRHCRWPIPDTQVWRYMMKLNQLHLAHPFHGTVISFSHFLPRAGLPFASFGGAAAKTMGCEQLDEQVRNLRGTNRLHVYGHSTKRHAEFIEGIGYVNQYHGEDGGKDENARPLLVFDGKSLLPAPFPGCVQ